MSSGPFSMTCVDMLNLRLVSEFLLRSKHWWLHCRHFGNETQNMTEK
jgi:hypothetical protein